MTTSIKAKFNKSESQTNEHYVIYSDSAFNVENYLEFSKKKYKSILKIPKCITF